MNMQEGIMGYACKAMMAPFVAFLLLPGATLAGAAEADALAALPRHAQLAGKLHASAQPSAEALRALPGAGVQVVIDLRPDAETPDLDEKAVVEQAGMKYQSLPISGAQDLTRENVMRLDRLLKQNAGQQTLLHCASGNRVGAMVALRARWLQGRSVEEAMAEGKAAGMTSLSAAVEQRLAEDAPPAR